MAGRGTDIILGGNPTFKVKQILTSLFMDSLENLKNQNKWTNEEFNQISFYLSKIFQEYDQNNFLQEEQEPSKEINLELIQKDISNLPYSLDTCLDSLRDLYNYFYKKISFEWQEQNAQVRELGGLFVLATERHETRRIDNQLRGRAGRQGDPGISQFFVSLDDELIKIFGGDNIRRWINYLMTDPDIPLESNFLTKSLEQAQEKVELYNYELRKNVFQYDEILNGQRKQFFEGRRELLSSNLYKELALRTTEFQMDLQLLEGKTFANKNVKNDSFECEKFFAYFTENKKIGKNSKKLLEIWIGIDLRFAHPNLYQAGFFQNTQNQTLLSILDFYWTEHIERMDYIRDTINWRSYGQQNPLIEYNLEAFASYRFMLEKIRESMLYYFLENTIVNLN
jgi:preprotein translocase subunit SecA